MICVGIDIAKGKSTVCFLKPGGEVLKTPYDMEHTAEEITKLIRDIRSYDEEVRVVLEATGHYHLPVVAQLLENVGENSPVNPLYHLSEITILHETAQKA